MGMNETPHQKAIHAYFAAYNAADCETLLRLFTQDIVVCDPVGQSRYIGVDEVREFYASAVRQGTRLVPIGVICGSYGNQAAVALTVIATLPDGARATVDVIDLFTFNAQGQICRIDVFFGPENIQYEDSAS